MISTRWLQQRQPYWQRLDELLKRSSTPRLGRLSRDELKELGLLYRQIASDLATVRQEPDSSRFAEYLNQLLARAHHIIYAANRQGARTAVRDFFRNYPRVFRANLGPCAVSLSIFLAGGLVGLLLTLSDPGFRTRVLGPEMVDTIDRHEMWTHSIVGIKPLASSRIMTNNLSVTLTAFAMGITGGIGTAYMIFFNGILLGVIGAACAAAGMSVSLWSFVAPHGSLELPSIVIAGGAGMRLAQGLLFPGRLPRRQSVSIAGAQAVQLALGCIPLLVIAGVIEAFVSPTELAVPLKFAMGSALFVLLFVYLARPAYRIGPRPLTDDPAV